MQFCAFCGEIRVCRDPPPCVNPLDTDPGLGMHKDEPLPGMWHDYGGTDKTSHICRFSQTRANPPRFGLCDFTPFLVRRAAKLPG